MRGCIKNAQLKSGTQDNTVLLFKGNNNNNTSICYVLLSHSMQLTRTLHIQSVSSHIKEDEIHLLGISDCI